MRQRHPTCDRALSRLLDEAMRMRGWTTLQDAADALGVSVATLSAYRLGKRGSRPRPATLRKLARGLDLPLDEVAATAGVPVPHDIDEEDRLLAAWRTLPAATRADLLAVLSSAAPDERRA